MIGYGIASAGREHEGPSFSQMGVAINLPSALRNSAANSSSHNALGDTGLGDLVDQVTLGKPMTSCERGFDYV